MSVPAASPNENWLLTPSCTWNALPVAVASAVGRPPKWLTEGRKQTKRRQNAGSGSMPSSRRCPARSSFSRRRCRGQSQVEQSNESEDEGNHCYQNVRTADSAVQANLAQAPQSKRLRSFGEGQPRQFPDPTGIRRPGRKRRPSGHCCGRPARHGTRLRPTSRSARSSWRSSCLRCNPPLSHQMDNNIGRRC